ncbi:hypothetical protein HBB16_04880 [Pseudonocardia sp. MCCB 268]|nr:hypothetical protein [Pseudonocardia cytotoxica]
MGTAHYIAPEQASAREAARPGTSTAGHRRLRVPGRCTFRAESAVAGDDGPRRPAATTGEDPGAGPRADLAVLSRTLSNRPPMAPSSPRPSPLSAAAPPAAPGHSGAGEAGYALASTAASWAAGRAGTRDGPLRATPGRRPLIHRSRPPHSGTAPTPPTAAPAGGAGHGLARRIGRRAGPLAPVPLAPLLLAPSVPLPRVAVVWEPRLGPVPGR